MISTLKRHLGCPTSVHCRLDTTLHPLAWADGGEQLGWGTAAADGTSTCFISEFLDLEASFGQGDSTTQAAVMRVFLGSTAGRKANTCKENSTPIDKIFLHKPNQGPDRSDPLWENWSHRCACKLFGEIIVSHFLATKYNIAATNNNTQRVFNGTHVHFKHESVFTTPLEDKRKVETKASEFVVATKAACSMDEGAQGWRCCWAAMLPCAMGGMRSRPTKQLHN